MVPVDWWSHFSLGMVTSAALPCNSRKFVTLCLIVCVFLDPETMLIQGSLRKSPSQAKEYIIPHGDWFDIVSSPHYLAEIVINDTLPSRHLYAIISFSSLNGVMLCNVGFIRGFADCEWRNRYNCLVTLWFRGTVHFLVLFLFLKVVWFQRNCIFVLLFVGWESIIIGWRNSQVVSPQV